MTLALLFMLEPDIIMIVKGHGCKRFQVKHVCTPLHFLRCSGIHCRFNDILQLSYLETLPGHITFHLIHRKFPSVKLGTGQPHIREGYWCHTIPAPSAASAFVTVKTSTKWWGIPAPLEAITGILIQFFTA